MLMPGVTAITPHLRLRIVGKPEYGSVVTPPASNAAPAHRQRRTTPFPPLHRRRAFCPVLHACDPRAAEQRHLATVAAAASAYVAASIRSGITSCSAPCNLLQPVIVIVGLSRAANSLRPSHSKNSPHPRLPFARRALIIVTPSASVAAIITLAVPSTVDPRVRREKYRAQQRLSAHGYNRPRP